MNISEINKSSEMIYIQRQPQITFSGKVAAPINDSRSSKGPTTKVSDYVLSKGLDSQTELSLINEDKSPKSTSTEIPTYRLPTHLGSRDTTPLVDNISSYSEQSSGRNIEERKSHFKAKRETLEIEDDTNEIEEVIETQEDMELAWETMAVAQKLASEGQWEQAHSTLLTIQNPFWRDAGYSTCAKLAANAAIDAKTKEAADISFSFCDKISHDEQKTRVTELVETMLHHEMKTSITEVETFSLDPNISPFAEARSYASSNYWPPAENCIARIQNPILRDRGYCMLAKIAANKALEYQYIEFAKISRGYCDKISDIDKKTQAIKLAETVEATLGNEVKTDIEKRSLIAANALQNEAQRLASEGQWKSVHIIISQINRPALQDRAYAAIAKIAASPESGNSKIAYEFCNQIRDKAVRAQTKTEINRLIGWKRWIPSNPCI